MPNSEGQSGSEGSGASSAVAVLRRLEAVLEGSAGWIVGLLRRHLLDIAAALVVIGGLLLLYAETLDLYRIVTPGGATASAPGSIKGAGDQHSWALGVIGVVIAAGGLLARWTRQRLPAWAAAALALLALAIVLIADLPDVTSSGLTSELETADAEPRDGFWVELAGALIALTGSMALALRLSRDAVLRRRT
jgi:hypothetical protein